ncbi:hypothetical protein AOQ84DRAFT_292923 [Glonium stellatum]|uniref:FYVE-type domain-containing protein n=1 Tax=Glonium stellatum TaxID=574774 RepID=A0A8E2F0X2_9PEZI|nr:hypothetical protein AOQ84DRAFT_292923 [Glonium stellatum]
MAADFSTATAVVAPPAFQQHAYKTSAPYTPMTSGATTPANVSPTSPRTCSNLSTLHLHTRQLRPPKSPLYVPAVLRPTEKPVRQSPPKTADSGLDSADSSWSASGRRATADSLESGISRVVTEEWNEEIQGPVTGPPSRNHWKVCVPLQYFAALRSILQHVAALRISFAIASQQSRNNLPLSSMHNRHPSLHLRFPTFLLSCFTTSDTLLSNHADLLKLQPDNSTSVCSASACHKPFSFFDRRHHCRRCGGIFCGAHSSNTVRLNQHALFHPNGSYYRACDRCFSNYREWQSRRKSISSSENSVGSSTAVSIESPITAKRPDVLRVGSLASSVPSNWAWSTF